MDVLSEKQRQLMAQEELLAKDLLSGRYTGDLVSSATKATTPNPFLPEQSTRVNGKPRRRAPRDGVVTK